MRRTRRRLQFAVSFAALAVVLVLARTSAGADTLALPGNALGTPLPPGWELCLLQGVGAAATQDNIADLDEWQAVEGGSTNNSAAFNPYNTLRMTDVNGAPLPGVISANGFPAFTDWDAGCAATVATLLQANMAPIVAALRAANISPPGVFLADVDKSPWCAPSNGVPCYASEILASDGVVLASNLTANSTVLADALQIYSESNAALSAYQEAVSATSSYETLVAWEGQQLQSATTAVSVAQGSLEEATRSLRTLAMSQYMDNGSVDRDASLEQFGAPDQSAVLRQSYAGVDATQLVARYDRARAEEAQAVARRQTASAAVVQAVSALQSAEAAQGQALTRLDSDMSTMEQAGACIASAPVTASAPTTQDATQNATTTSSTPAPAPASPAAGSPAPAPSTPGPAPSAPAPGASAPPASPSAPNQVEVLQTCLAALAPLAGT